MSAPLTQAHKDRFIEFLRSTGNPSVSARAVGYSPSCMRDHKMKDGVFSQEWDEALLEAADALEQEARRRAINGVVRKKVLGFKDDFEIVDEIHYSDSLLLAMLKAKKPDEYADRTKSEISNPDGSLSAMGETEIAAKISSLLAIAQARMKQEGGE